MIMLLYLEDNYTNSKELGRVADERIADFRRSICGECGPLIGFKVQGRVVVTLFSIFPMSTSKNYTNNMLFDGIISSTLHQPLGLTGTVTGVENGDIHQPTGLVDEIIVSSSTNLSKRGWVVATLELMHTVYILLPLSLEHYILIETQRRELIGGFY